MLQARSYHRAAEGAAEASEAREDSRSRMSQNFPQTGTVWGSLLRKKVVRGSDGWAAATEQARQISHLSHATATSLVSRACAALVWHCMVSGTHISARGYFSTHSVWGLGWLSMMGQHPVRLGWSAPVSLPWSLMSLATMRRAGDLFHRPCLLYLMPYACYLQPQHARYWQHMSAQPRRCCVIGIANCVHAPEARLSKSTHPLPSLLVSQSWQPPCSEACTRDAQGGRRGIRLSQVRFEELTQCSLASGSSKSNAKFIHGIDFPKKANVACVFEYRTGIRRHVKRVLFKFCWTRCSLPWVPMTRAAQPNGHCLRSEQMELGGGSPEASCCSCCMMLRSARVAFSLALLRNRTAECCVSLFRCLKQMLCQVHSLSILAVHC